MSDPLTKILSTEGGQTLRKTANLHPGKGKAAQDADKSQPAMAESPACDRLNSPSALLETGLRMRPPEKSRDIDRLRCRAALSLQSGLSGKNREIRACFAYFGVWDGGFYVQFRLRGGGREIRTLGTVLSR